MPMARHRTSLLAIAGLIFAAAPAAAQVLTCGDDVGPGAKVTLTADVGPCTSAAGAAVHVTGPATLDLAGFRIFCDPNDPANGLLVDGKGAKIMKGSIEGCVRGLDLTGGEGKHKVEDLVVRDSTGDGVDINSDKNKLKRVTAIGSGADGFEIDGDGTKIEDAEAVDNDAGFSVRGAGTKLVRIVASSNTEFGLLVDGSAGQTKVKDCRLTDNGSTGATIANDTKLDKCLASANTDGGFVLEGESSEIKKSLALDNGNSGFRAVNGANGNRVKQSVALGHPLDMVDDNTGCGSNTWQKNKFGSSEADGVPDPACID